MNEAGQVRPDYLKALWKQNKAQDCLVAVHSVKAVNSLTPAFHWTQAALKKILVFYSRV